MKEQARTANDARDEIHQTEGNSLKRKSFTAAQHRMDGVAENINADDTDATDDEFRPSVEQPEFVVPGPEDFPSMPVRTGRGSLSEILMRVFVKLLAKCTVGWRGGPQTQIGDFGLEVALRNWPLQNMGCDGSLDSSR